MKRAVSISIGSSKRDKSVTLSLLGETVLLERIGTDGDLEKAARLYSELDGKVDALGVGGGVLGLMVGKRWYPMVSLLPVVRGVKHTPLVDGTGLKLTLERQAVVDVDRRLNGYIPQRKALVVSAVDRWGMAQGALDAGYSCVFGDLLYSVGLQLPISNPAHIHIAATIAAPLLCRLPFRWVYPIGKAQETRKPTFTRYFEEANLILGDCHYIWKYMPERMDGKIIVTNTTTPDDLAFFRASGAKFLVTTTPVLDGRSFGTNLLEAAIVAAAGRRDPIDYAKPDGYFQWMERIIGEIGLSAQIQELNS